VLESFGNPQNKIKTIHVAGTNGKGSTCAMLASVLQESGYLTGLFTSPHLIEYTERIKINNKDISKEDFAELIFQVINRANFLNIQVTEFEILTIVGFIYFFEKKVDIAVIETGLGGRLDATNVINSPEVTIITDIDFDHTDRLGNTIYEIACEKAGIIKTDKPIITLEDNKGIEVIKKIAQEKQSPFLLTKFDFGEGYKVNLEGLWQKRNLALVIKAIKCLREKGVKISNEGLKNGLEKVSWPGRFQYIKEKNILIDSAHNPHGALALRQSLDFYFPDIQRIFLYSSLKTKDYEVFAKNLFKKNDIIVLTKFSFHSSEEPLILSYVIKEFVENERIIIINNTNDAVKYILNLEREKYLKIITGSMYAIGQLLGNFSII
jgi:dihydrofolate synthase/folylpolyglutamate synthase